MIFGSRNAFPENPIYPQALNTLFLALAVASAPHFFSLPLWVTALFMAALATKFFLVKHSYNRVGELLPKLLAVPAVALIYLQFNSLIGLEASISLLVVMLGMKVLELKDYRDAMLCLFLGYFVVVTVFLFHQELITLPYLIATVVFQVLALTKLNDITGEQSTKLQLKTTFKLCFFSLPIVAVMFVLFPRLDSPLWSLPGNNQQSRTGMSESMMPGQFSKLVNSTEPVFRVTFNAGIPAQDKLYWRGPVLTDFDGKVWSRRSKHFNDNLPTVAPGAQPIHYRVTVESQQNNKWLFPLDMPTNFDAGIVVNRDGETKSKDWIRKTSIYDFSSALEYTLNEVSNNRDLIDALVLPRGSLRTKRLAKDLFESTGRNKEKFVDDVMNRFNTEPYSYTLDPMPLSSDYVDSFLFDTREGFCEHYSSSFVVMMRSVGIPARVVTGYQGGEFNSQANYMLVRQSDAHAWAEVWLEGQGWIRKDPTSMVSPERVNQGIDSAFAGSDLLPNTIRFSFLKRMSLKWDTLNYYWSSWVVSYNSSMREEIFSSLKRLMGTLGKHLVLSLTMLSIAVFLFLFAQHFWGQRNTSKHRAVRVFEDLVNRCQSKYDIHKHSNETSLQYANKLTAANPGKAAQIREIFNSYHDIYYGQDDRDDRFHDFKKLTETFLRA